MSGAGVTPALFVGEILAALALVGVLGVLGLGVRRRPGRASGQDRWRRFLNREGEFAGALGWQTNRWLAVRGVVTLAGFGYGVWTGVPLLMVAGLLGGGAGVRWLLAGRAATNRLKMEREFLDTLTTLGGYLQHMPLNVALREVGRNPGEYLEDVLRPLDSDMPIDDRIEEVARRSHSALIESTCISLLAARARDPETFRRAIEEDIVPTGRGQLALAEEGVNALTQQRSVAIVMVILMVVMFVAITSQALYAEYYRSLGGQLLLIAVILLFGILVWLLGKIVSTPRRARWDIGVARRVLRDLGGV